MHLENEKKVEQLLREAIELPIKKSGSTGYTDECTGDPDIDRLVSGHPKPWKKIQDGIGITKVKKRIIVSDWLFIKNIYIIKNDPFYQLLLKIAGSFELWTGDPQNLTTCDNLDSPSQFSHFIPATADVVRGILNDHGEDVHEIMIIDYYERATIQRKCDEFAFSNIVIYTPSEFHNLAKGLRVDNPIINVDICCVPTNLELSPLFKKFGHLKCLRVPVFRTLDKNLFNFCKRLEILQIKLAVDDCVETDFVESLAATIIANTLTNLDFSVIGKIKMPLHFKFDALTDFSALRILRFSGFEDIQFDQLPPLKNLKALIIAGSTFEISERQITILQSLLNPECEFALDGASCIVKDLSISDLITKTKPVILTSSSIRLDFDTKNSNPVYNIQRVMRGKTDDKNPDPGKLRGTIFQSVYQDQQYLFEPMLEDWKKIKVNLIETEKWSDYLQTISDKSSHGCLRLSLNTEQWMPLLGVNIFEILVAAEEIKGIPLEFSRSSLTGRFAVKLTALSEQKQNKIYNASIDVRYVLSPISPLPSSVQSGEFVLDSRLKYLIEMAALNPEIQQLFPKFIILTQKMKIEFEDYRLNAVKCYCTVGHPQGFTAEDLSPINLWEILPILQDHEYAGFFGILNLILQQKGVCRHAAQAAEVLYRFIGTPARLVYSHIEPQSSVHAYCEIARSGKSNQNYLWETCDLNGGLAQVNIDEKKLAPLSSTKKIPTQVKISKKVSQSLYKNTEKLSQDLITLWTEFNITPSSTTKFCQEIRSSKNPRVYLPAKDSQASQIGRGIYHVIASLDKDLDCLYISDPEQLPKVLKDHYIIAGDIKETPGILIECERHNKAMVLVIQAYDWLPREIVNYNCLFDKAPNLNGHPLSDHIKVIFLLNPETHLGSDFTTRSKAWHCNESLTKSFLEIDKSLTLMPPESELKEVKTINLYHHPELWRSSLLGTCAYTSTIVFQPGMLAKMLTAEESKTDTGILLINAPLKESAFLDWHAQVVARGKIRVNGEDISVPKNFHLRTVEISEDLLDLAPFQLIVPEDCWTLYLSQSNFACFMSSHGIESTAEFKMAGLLPETLKGSLRTQLPGLIEQMIDEPFHAENLHIQVTETLDPGQLSRLKAYVKDLLKVKKANLFISFSPLQMAYSSRIISSYDIDYTAAELIQSEMSGTVIYINPQTSKKHFADSLTLDSVTLSVIAQKLISGEVVTLVGNPGKELFQALASATDLGDGNKHRYLVCNGRIQPVIGRLRWVMSVEAAAVLGNQAIPKKIDFDDYQHLLKDEKAYCEENWLRLKEFYLFTCYIPGGVHSSGQSLWNYRRVRDIMRELSRTDRPANPVKFLIHSHYQHSPHYTMLKVIAELLFFRSDEDKRFIQTSEEISQSIWKAARLFHPADLYRIWDIKDYADIINLFYIDSNNILTLKPKFVEDFSTAFHSRRGSLGSGFFKQTGQKKFAEHEINRLKNIENVLHHRPWVYVIGNAGAGKSFSLKHLPDAKIYRGTEKIHQWLTSTEEGAKILQIDEAHLFPHGTFDWLKGLDEEKPVVWYEGRRYPLTSQHKVYFTANYVSPGVKEDPFLSTVDRIIFKRPPADATLIREIIDPVLKDIVGSFITSCSQIMMAGFHFMYENMQKKNKSFSPRDLNGVVSRLHSLIADSKHLTEEQLKIQTINACLREWAGLVAVCQEDNLLQQLQDRLCEAADLSPLKLNELPDQKHLEICKLIQKKYPDLILLPVVKEQISVIYENMLMKPPAKLGFILEGPPGIGKSTLITAVLEVITESKQISKSNYTLCSVTGLAGMLHCKKNLSEKYLQGGVVLIDELNLLDPDNDPYNLLYFLLCLLEGVHPDYPDTKPHPNFKLALTQNSSLLPGRKPLPPALMNRLNLHYFKDYNREELLNLATGRKIINSSLAVAAFTSLQKLQEEFHIEISGSRLFFKFLDELPHSRNSSLCHGPGIFNSGEGKPFSSSSMFITLLKVCGDSIKTLTSEKQDDLIKKLILMPAVQEQLICLDQQPDPTIIGRDLGTAIRPKLNQINLSQTP